MLFRSAKVKRVTHITFHKCGSQWVRDVLVAPEIKAYSHFEDAKLSPNIIHFKWPQQAKRTVLGPVYYAKPADFLATRKRGDKSIFVLRDPRDRMISYIFSIAFSHVGSSIMREPLRSLSTRQKLQFGIYDLGSVSSVFREWAAFPAHPDVFKTSYERIVENDFEEFKAIMRFLDWPVPDDVLERVVTRLSFKARSGREPGDVNLHSHYRKGEPGDWRNYFDKSLGAEFERIHPDLLVACGYERSSLWYEDLPESLPSLESNGPCEELDQEDLKADVIRLTEKCNQLAQGLLAKDAFISRLQEESMKRP